MVARELPEEKRAEMELLLYAFIKMCFKIVHVSSFQFLINMEYMDNEIIQKVFFLLSLFSFWHASHFP